MSGILSKANSFFASHYHQKEDDDIWDVEAQGNSSQINTFKAVLSSKVNEIVTSVYDELYYLTTCIPSVQPRKFLRQLSFKEELLPMQIEDIKDEY